jgi:hypothetical protein
MIIILKSGVGDAEIEVVCSRITEMGYHPHIIRGEFKTVVAAVGEERGRPDLRLLEALETWICHAGAATVQLASRRLRRPARCA